MVQPVSTIDDQVHSHSATVELFLHVSGIRYSLADVGPADAKLDCDAVFPPTKQNGILEIIVDGRSKKTSVEVSGSEISGRVCLRRAS